MPSYRISQAARLLGVSADTVRRWADGGRLGVTRDDGGRRWVDGEQLASLAASLAEDPEQGPVRHSARNRLTGIVTKVVKDTVMAQVELAAGPFRLVALISREAADELELAPGVMVTAVIKATNLTIEAPRPSGPDHGVPNHLGVTDHLGVIDQDPMTGSLAVEEST